MTEHKCGGVERVVADAKSMLEQIVKTDQALHKLPIHLKLPTGSSSNSTTTAAATSPMQDAATDAATALAASEARCVKSGEGTA